MRCSHKGAAAALIAITLLASGLSIHASCTSTIGPDKSIQMAVDAASEGAVICLTQGTWVENILIDKGLTLRGTGTVPSLIRGRVEDPVPGVGDAVLAITAAEGPASSYVMLDHLEIAKPDPREIPAFMVFGPGWHLLSVPSVGADKHPSAVFSDVLGSGQPLIVYAWLGSSSYVTPGEIDPGRGYWLYLVRAVTIEAQGVAPTQDHRTLLSAAGWHLVSTPRWPVAWESVTFEHQGASYTLSEAVADGLIDHIAFRYDPAVDAWYVPIDLTDAPGTLDPWTGYWLKTLADNVTMVIPLGSNPSPPTAAAAYTGVIPQELQPPAPPQSVQAGPLALTALSYPNPVTAGKTTFTVTGVAAEHIAVRVFDLSGREIWRGAEEGNALGWEVTDARGRAVPSGVYLYYVEVRVAGLELRTGLEKLLIVR